jgi:GntR family transcriptional repressor for pyruvate dehydrogenase complex
MENQDRLFSRLEAVTLERGLRPGDKLPPERALAERMGVSRNTLRGLLRCLDARGVVAIKPGSGTYLRTGLAGAACATRPSATSVADQIKAAILILPPILCKALQTISGLQLNELHACNVALSQAMCSGDPHEIWTEIARYFRIIVNETGNAFLVGTVERMFRVDPDFVGRFFHPDRAVLDELFAGHVSILQALRERNLARMSALTGQYLLILCRALEGDGFSVWDPAGRQGTGGDMHGK